ncbi:MAG: hypothetical protein ACTSUV_01065 [Candidatus Ranarchaeia archaeon]
MKVFDVQPDGDLIEKEYSKVLLTDIGVLIFTNDKAEHIYIWKGENAPVRNRFVASRAASEIRTKKGLHYKVISIDPGDRHKEFFELIGESLPEKAEPPVEEVVEPVAPYQPPVMPQTLNIPKEFPTPKRTRKIPSHVPTQSPVQTEVNNNNNNQIIQKVLEKLMNLKVPPGYSREVIIIGDKIYTITERIRTFFGKSSSESNIEELRNPPQGTFFATNYIPRVIIEEGEILAIEFLKGSSEEVVLDQKEKLTDLVDFFKNIGTETLSLVPSKNQVGAERGFKL